MKKTTKYKPIYRVWSRQDGKYQLANEVFEFDDDVKEYSMLMYDCEGVEIFEFDILHDERGEYVIKFVDGTYLKKYRTGEVEYIQIIGFTPGKIVNNKMKE